MSRREIWQEIYQRFDIDERVTSERWRADRSRSLALELAELLSTPFSSDARILVTGTSGTGKTTGLLHLVEARSSHELVVFLDLARYFERLGRVEGLQHVSPWEVCFLAGLALHRAAEEKLGCSFPGDVLEALDSAWTELARASGTPVPAQLDLRELGELIVTAGVASVGGLSGGRLVMGAGGPAEALRMAWNLRVGASSRLVLDDDERAKAMLDTVNRMIGAIEARHRPVLLVIDGLDRVGDVDQVRRLFVESDMLARLACRVVVCGPFALYRHEAVSDVPRFQLYSLLNEPVLDPHDPQRPGPGLPFFTELFLRRTDDLGSTVLVEPLLLDRLAYYSGGRARDFVNMIRLVAEEAWQADADAATEEIVDGVIDQERRLLETGLHRGHIDVLEAVMRDPDHRLPDDALVWELLTLSRLLPYQDRSEWFYPHPLLTRHLLSRAGPASARRRERRAG